MSPIDYKTKVIEEISVVEDDDTLQKLYSVVHSFLEDYDTENGKLSFEEWNKQFDDDLKLDDFIPEYGMTLREFRMSIYEAETSQNEKSINIFQNKLQNIYGKA
ncbi:MAG: hypothetical protein GXO49_07985 [Chlorobi bacterium]|nr:hypothetical protein [Chlorobiota bacterium]